MIKIQSRDYQQNTIDNIIDSYDKGIRSVLAVLATGMGKTFTAILSYLKFRELYGGKCLFLVDQIDLAYQARESFMNVDPTLRIGIEMDYHKASKQDDVVIASIQSISRVGVNRIKRLNPDEFKFIIADEAHKSLSDSWMRVLHYMGTHPDNFDDTKMLLGLTATPKRNDNVRLGILYDDIIGKWDIKYGIQQGWLTEIEVYSVDTRLDISKLQSIKDTQDGDLSNLLNVQARNELIVKTYFELCPNEKVIVYCADVNHAYEVAATFLRYGVDAQCIEANTDKTDRSDWINDYRHGNLNVLTNYGTLTTGFDSTETSAIFIARPFRSTTTYIQTVGRGLRPSKTAYIDECSTTEERLANISISSKPVCKLVDFCDITGNHELCRPPSLFGLNPKMKIDNGMTLYKEVVEPLEEAQQKHQLNLDSIVDISMLDMIVKRNTIKLRNFKPSEFIKELSDFKWYEVADNTFQLNLTSDRKNIIVEQNMLNKYDLLEHDLKTGLTLKLQTFNDISGAIKTADEYAESNYNTRYSKYNAIKSDLTPTDKQLELFARLFKWDKRFEKSYVNKTLVVKEDGVLVTRDRMSELLDQKFNIKWNTSKKPKSSTK